MLVLIATYQIGVSEEHLTPRLQICLPRDQVSASEVEPASKYRIALLSTTLSVLPCSTLAGSGTVCILSTAQRSYSVCGFSPFDGSLQRTRRSLQRMPTSGRGVASVVRQSTCTRVFSPSGLYTSLNVWDLRTTRARTIRPSMTRRLFVAY